MAGTIVDISVIIPTYHRFEPLQNTIESLLAQSVLPQQIIVIDNSSTEARRRPLNLESNSKTECIYIDSKGVGNANRARNEGIRGARCEILLFLDDDMRLPPNTLEKFLEVHREGWDAVNGLVLEEGKTHERKVRRTRPLWYLLKHRHGFQRTHTIAVSSGFVSVRADAIRRIGLLDEGFPFSFDDYDLGFRLWDAGFTIIHDPRVVGHHLHAPMGGGRQLRAKGSIAANRVASKYRFLGKHFGGYPVLAEAGRDMLAGLRHCIRNPIGGLTGIWQSIYGLAAYARERRTINRKPG